MKKLPQKKTIHPTTQYAKDIVDKKIVSNHWVFLACKRHLTDLKEGKARGLYFSEEDANHAISFFPEFLSFYEGDFSDKPFHLTPNQKFIIGSIFGWKKIEDNLRRFKTAYIEEAKGNGKALDIRTLVPTINGFKTMGSLKVGDKLFDHSFNDCTVINISEILYDRPCFKLRFSDETNIISDENHSWLVQDDYHKFAIFKVSTKQIYECLKNKKIIHLISSKEVTRRDIISCEKINSVPVKCIEVDSLWNSYLVTDRFIPTHNSPLAGGIGLYGLTFDDEPGAEIYAAAVTKEQAGILFRDAHTFAEKSPELSEILTIDKNNIAYLSENSFFRAISSEHRGLDGKRPHIALIDEIHEHPNDLVVRKMSAGTKTRRQPLICETTNAGYDRHSICFQHHEYTEKVLEGLIEDDTWFGMMSGLDVCDNCREDGKTTPQDGCPDCDDWRNPEVWEKANPNMKYLGKPFVDYLHKQVNEAKEMPSQQNIVKRLNFCVWTESFSRWISADKWASCRYNVVLSELKGRRCYAGLDLSSNIDITALIYVFPPWVSEESFEGNRKLVGSPDKYQVLCRFFIPEDNIRDRVYKDKVPYDVWVNQGYITTTPGNIIDYDFILSQIKKDTEEFDLSELAFDRWGSQKITTDLQNDCGFQLEGKEKTLIQFGQGFASMSAPTKEVEKMVLAEEIAHNGNPVLSWMMSNVVIKTDPAENKKPDKEKSTERIDGAVGLIMAIDRAVLKNGPVKPVYEGLSVEEMKARMAF